METKWLQDFLVLAEVRHFSRAAALRHITQPAFGRHIQALEQAVGQQLVDRSTTPISLTAAGRQFHSLARSLVMQLEQGLDALNGADPALFHPIRIASPHALASPLLLDLISPPDAAPSDDGFAVDIMRVDEAEAALTEGRCDFVLAFDVLALLKPPYRSLLLGGGDFLLVSAPGADGQAAFNPSEEQVPYLRYSADAYSARLLHRHNVDAALSLRPVFETSMCQLLAEMALRGEGVAWLPDALIRPQLAAGTLCPVAPECLHVPYQVRLYRQQGRLAAAAETFWQQLETRLAGGWHLLTPWHESSGEGVCQVVDKNPAFGWQPPVG